MIEIPNIRRRRSPESLDEKQRHKAYKELSQPKQAEQRHRYYENLAAGGNVLADRLFLQRPYR